MTNRTQIAVIGAGPGGYSAAFLAADLGSKVSLIDTRPNPGGVCLYEGCIPSKAYLHIASILDDASHSKKFGIHFDKPKIDIQGLRNWKQEVVQKLTGGLGQLCKARNISYLQGYASFVNPKSLKIKLSSGKEEILEFEHAIIATGSVPVSLPHLPKAKNILDSSEALEIKKIPSRLLVVGGGYIGLEMSTVYSSLGSVVHVVEMSDQLLPGTDMDLVKPLASRLSNILDKIHLNTSLKTASQKADKIKVQLENKSGKIIEESYDSILTAIGRRPSLKGIGLENTAIRLTNEGFIHVDGSRRTVEPNIYAIGDVTEGPMLAHKASHEGKIAIEVIHGKKAVFEPYAIPAVIFTDPELAYCGLTETEAKKTGVQVKISSFPWSASGRAVSLDRTEGMTKLVLEPQTGRVLGVGIVGKGAGDLIAEGVLAVEMGAVAKDLALSIHPHPTLSETIMEASEIFLGQSTHIYKPAT